MEMLSNKAGIRKCYITVILLFYIVVCILLTLGVRVFLYVFFRLFTHSEI